MLLSLLRFSSRLLCVDMECLKELLVTGTVGLSVLFGRLYLDCYSAKSSYPVPIIHRQMDNRRDNTALYSKCYGVMCLRDSKIGIFGFLMLSSR